MIEYQDLLKKAYDLWPMRVDMNPRTMREEAMLKIVCELISQVSFTQSVQESEIAERESTREQREGCTEKDSVWCWCTRPAPGRPFYSMEC